MSNENRDPQTLAIAALVVACVSLVLSLLVAGFLLLKTSGEHAIDSALPQYLSEKRLAGIAESIVEPFNAGDFDGLYNVFDPAARAQLSVDILKKQVSALRPTIGKIDTASYVGWQKNRIARDLAYLPTSIQLKAVGGRLFKWVTERQSHGSR